ncbi:hypothetical protein GCM10027160_45090 [Streptomyces calidiresistens]|uniref:DUF3558 domain-containing protein n=1 Tax=Streptomyces calidiresistens TaxID=1485586 RepID=A0A7W3T3T2_9ACTN|nr:DUF3558 domain-containing protein [Streptomyces calidiresistens]MBB0230081.1 DUF3558 domain-containing protein [Streptomyces calidiresistens]
MRRMAFIAGAALPGILLVTLLSCSSDLGEDVGNGTGNGTGPATSAGRYSTLPEPCGAVDRELLTALLPEAAEETLAGVPRATFNTARRVGCVWEVRGDRGTHRLSVDFLRVVSYDPGVSDEEQAERDFVAAAEAAGLDLRPEPEEEPDASPPPGTGGTDGGEDDGSQDTGGTGRPDGEAPGTEETGSADGDDRDSEGSTATPDPRGTGGDTDPDDTGDTGDAGDGDTGDTGEDTGPRLVENTGQEAWLDDRLATDADGSLREIVVTFRTSNAIVTVTLAEDFGPGGVLPQDAEARDRTVELARRLAVRFEE